MPTDDPRPLFARVPDEAVGTLYAVLRERCEGGANYTPPAPGSNPMQEFRSRLKSLSSSELDRAYKEYRRQLAGTPATRGAADPTRELTVGGGIRGGSVSRGPTYEQMFAERARSLGR